jgi:hypothetical protein
MGELAFRVAFGGSRSHILGIVLRRALTLSVLGIFAGATAFKSATRDSALRR